MPPIVERLPFYENEGTLRIPGGPAVRIKHHQMAIWVSVTKPEVQSLPPNAPRFPAVLDTGFNDSFLIREQELNTWAGIQSGDLSCVGFLKTDFGAVPLLYAKVWLHPNLPGFRDQFSGAAPAPLRVPNGVAVPSVRAQSGFRLPLLGNRLLDYNRLEVLLDYARRWISISPSPLAQTAPPPAS